MQKNRKLVMIAFAAAGVLSCVGAILMLTVFRSASADSVFRTVLGSVCGVLLFMIALLIFYYVYLLVDREPNFFLYNKQTHRNISVDKLSFSVVNEKMTFYISLIDPHNELLWTTDLLSENDRFGYRGVYRPLVAYKMLFNLIVAESDTEWNRIVSADNHQIQLLCEALEQNHEEEMTKAIRYIHANFQNAPKKMEEFIKGNKRYLQGKMLSYAKKNIEAFY